MSEENSNPTSESNGNATSNSVASISDKENQSTACHSTLGDVIDGNNNNTIYIDDVNGNQLVPDILHKTEESGIVEDSTSTNDAAGDQVVDGSENESREEDEEIKLIEMQISKGVLTTSMLDQEKELQQQQLEEEKHIVSEAMEEWETTVEKQRYTRLQHLLQKSNIYSMFLLKRIEEQKAENEKKKTRKSKEPESGKSEEDKDSPQTVPKRKSARKGKQKSTTYNITDYVDTEALKKISSESVVPHVSDKDDTQAKFAVEHHSSKTDSSETGNYETPKLLTGGTLRDYQKEGVEWLKVLFENGVNGILADEMGLGKTVQCIALIAHLIEKGVQGPFLVTAPLSTLPNWLSEFKRFTPDICSLIYHGIPDERAKLRKKFSRLHGEGSLKSFPVAITSYGIIMRDRAHLVKYNWKYLIVDEGHRLKDTKCLLIRELKAFSAANRLLLTGTPLQNKLSELWSLLNFILPDIFNDLNNFQAWFDFSAISESDGSEKIIKQEREHHVLERLHAILTPFLLRRLKCDVSLEVPPKKEIYVYATLTQKQKYWYKLLLDKTRLHDVLKDEKQSTPPSTPSLTPSGRTRRSCRRNTDYSVYDSDKLSYDELMEIMCEEDERKKEAKRTVSTPKTCERNIKIMNILMMLRKTCMHPYLLEYPLDPVTQDYRIDEELIASSGKTLLLDQMLPELKRRGHKILLFSQMTKLLDIMEDFCYLRDYKYTRIDGSTTLEDRQIKIEDFNKEPDVFIFLLSTRAGGLGLNLTAADTVIIFDSDWNPQQDLQAQDRCHRIGQTKPVVVYRLITANSVEERIVEVACEKRRLEKMVIHKERFKGTRDDTKLSPKELVELLQSSDHTAAINSDDISDARVLSPEQLDKLLDRSDMISGDTTVPEATDKDDKLFKVV
ncbi:lymphoid-specific helicase-like [Dendronephthya gigantea]|uniref:lymphoid-specific helicase-like n=1 Tax=Dendronephthya gigantea TaxID=151771 RepID=UPI00106AC5D7|nr:lymphoid-specific helicase-like [Dendronephthya gigantea]